MNLLKIENVSYKYKKNHPLILNDVSCAFDKGKVYSIIGKSGSGKTTLLSLLAGFESPTEGTIYYCDEPINKDNIEKYRKNNISYIFQDYQLFPKLTVWENVTYPLNIKNAEAGDSTEIVEAILTEVGIDKELWQFYPSQISGGEQQRVAIARALALGGKIMLADEPTGNLDSENAKNIMELFRKLAEDKGMCVIMVTHDSQVSEMSDFVYKMVDGHFEN